MYKFLVKSIWYFRKQHFAVFMGTVIGTAVLTGALIIGDSVRYSLRSLVDKRLGNTEFVLNTSGRFVRANLASDMAKQVNIKASPLLLLPGIAIHPESNSRINNTQVIGIDRSFDHVSPQTLPVLLPDEAIISENLAQALLLKPGDEFLLRVENASIIPLNTPLVPENKPSVAFRLTVKFIANDSCLGRFSLKSNQTAPYNIFISREFLAEKLSLKGLANVILFSGATEANLKLPGLEKALTNSFQLADAGLKLRELNYTDKYELVSDRIFIDNPISTAIQSLKFSNEKIITYLVNALHHKASKTPYSFVTAASHPLVPTDLKENEIIVNSWLSDDLNVSVGDTIVLDYYAIGPLRTLTEKSKPFIVKQIIPTEGGISDRNLMPAFPGLSDAGSCRDWDSGIPIDFKQIRDKDEKYWNDYRGTPKAFISIETGRKLWGNLFGNYTALRFDKKNVPSLQILEQSVLSALKPGDIGITIVPVRDNGLNAASNSVDFGELFLSLSFFIIVAAIMLTMLVYALNTELRFRETAILSGLGYSPNRIIFMRFAESWWVIVFGGITGALGGIAYNYFLVAGLNTVWRDAVREKMLLVNITPTTLAIGAISGIVLALISVYVVTRRKLKKPTAVLIKGYINDSKPVNQKQKFSKILAITGILGALVLVCISIFTSSYENAGLFLSAGGLFLIGSTAIVSLLINKPFQFQHKVLSSINGLAFKNARYSKTRSLTVVLVLGIGTFIVILTGSYRKTYYGGENLRESGTGGYSLWIETTMPVPYNLNAADARENLATHSESDLDSVHFMQLSTLDGDDASCLNLNQVKHPRILGVNPVEFDKRDAFSFVQLLEGVDSEHPWLELDNEKEDVVLAYADQSVLTYGLKKSVGDTLTYVSESGETVKIRLIGGLDNSIFQGNILVSSKIFARLFPSAGSKVMLADVPKNKQNLVAEIVNTSLSDFGAKVERTSERLSAFNSVENTYLSVFMFLGGLGLLLGTFGLGIILYRNILERQHELALLMALGYRKQQVFRLVFSENAILLIYGLLCGLLSAVIGVFPSMVSPAFSIQGWFLVVLVLAIFLVGILLIYTLTRMALKKNLLQALQEE